MDTPHTIDKRTLGGKAAEWIRDAIASGDFEPGKRLTEIDLAAQIGLSRSTVRSAMQRLASEGLLVQHPYTGWEVLSLSQDDAWDLYTLRSALEGLAARLAAERINDSGRQTLLSALAEFKGAVAAEDWRRVAKADLQLHRTIVALSGNMRLASQYAQVIDVAQLYIFWTNTFADSPKALFELHEKLVSLIIHQDAKGAERLAIEHVSLSGIHVVEALKAMSIPALR